MSKNITVIDYGMGNIWSVLSALRYLGCTPVVSNDPDEIVRAESLLLPGVGSFRKAMYSLRESSIDQAILEAVHVKGSKILGICLGMQLMGSQGHEDGETPGLGLIPNSIDLFTPYEIGPNKIPHIGFDLVNSRPDSILFQGLPNAADFYFVHSYRMLPHGLKGKAATCFYGTEFLAAYELDNIFATQFHPEKSQTNGLMLLENFLSH
ncbi:MAG: imidazole glycerol phosphate synthase subunit HisH [Rhodoferax sp.]|nr:imidazole glycerol phosphate synthase subunit HisH [Rhodoferax sp.]MDP3651337.1 imidazole glycerol phosphate synthase subunit HisH [Rhodoferax sp.]